MIRDLIKSSIQRTMRSFGLEVRRSSTLPFGVEWYRDIKFFQPHSTKWTVFDVGANRGQTALKVIKEFPDCRIFSFEPVPSTFAELSRNTARHPSIEPIEMALGSSKGIVQITGEPLSVTNTILHSGSAQSPTRRIDIKIDTADSFSEARGIDSVNLLKIDTEGYELEVLKGAANLLNSAKIDFVLAECDFHHRLDEPHGNFTEIRSFLEQRNYHVVSFYTGGVDDLGWIWGDVLFKKSATATPRKVSCSPAA